MNSDDFRKFGKEVVDYIADYLDNIREKQVLSSVEPGYLRHLLPPEAPQTGEPWEAILHDVDRIITPGLTHWDSPHFHAYYPTANSYPATVADIILSGLGALSTDSFSDPICDAFELKMMDWLAKLINLPEHFLNSSGGKGGGIIQNSASDSTLIALLSAKNRKNQNSNILVAYTSENSNSSVEKSGLLASVTMRLLPTDKKGSLRGNTLFEAIESDLRAGYTPCCVIATLGTTGTCAFDQLDEIGRVCRRFQIWLHVDAAYAGAAFCCPEFRPLMKGVEFADSFNFNPHKWMLVNTDCSAMWFRDRTPIEELFNRKSEAINIQFLQISDERRFRALKLWFVLRVYGVEGVRNHIRKQVALAKYFEQLVMSDSRFEVCTATMGLVCFRVKGHDSFTEDLIDKVTKRKNVFVMPYNCQNKVVIRFVICSRLTEEKDILLSWRELQGLVDSSIKVMNVLAGENQSM